MNSFEADPTEPGAVSEPERLLQPVPEGRRITVMLAAFEGWNDAGEAASDALRYLNKLWGGKKVGAIDADEYYDFQFTRPTIRRTAAGERKIKWPSTRIFKASVPDSNVDVIFVQGTEPSYKWRAYTAELLVHAEALHVDYVILVGALLADVPHSRPIPVSTSTDDAALRERMDLEASQYEGPVGIVGVLGEVALLAGLPTVSLWAAVPHYVAQAPSPKAQLALLHRVEELLQVPLDTTELVEEADAWERGVDELATEDPEIAAYVRQLEEAKDTADLPEASGESIAREFERYLKRRGKDKP
ncbi:Predicted ATP-dependent carboligase, ATP-grasp superfamily [Arthrobacter sp. 49Tsu3.1M3]|jgi:predicted ATP-grasp superfamily ATP-dependent carboligase|uniref:PAC2 family protein n=1 Tax=Arthrobacter TaxID=1663 RepID=UPI00037A5FD9|nr:MULTISPECIES: PAC2 family protein [Arthrobacter]MCI9869526.1 PAC2 family protein [Arthrobacter humicola]SKB34151.1 Predicted ATP-dependent carboligase, ATP-grasp superfamily [Arthrobacter sp. 49Tsu3.1M3]